MLWHGSAALLAFAALRALTRQTWPSAFAAALFALHPLRAESVAWASERRDVVCGAFWMATLLAYAGWARRGGLGRWALVAAGTALALLAKPMAVTLPAVLLLLDFWPLGRLRRLADAPRLVAEKLPLFALSAACAAMAVHAQRAGGSVVSLDMHPPGVRLANAALAAVTYLRQTVWPVDLAPFYPHPGGGISFVHAGLAAAALAVATLLCVVFARRAPWAPVGWLWFLGTLVPVLGLVQVGAQAHADRYTYLPSLGLALLVAFGGRAALARLAPRGAAARGLGAAAAVVLVLAGTAFAAAQTRIWRDSETLWTHALAAAPGSWIAHMNLGAARLAAGDAASASRHYAEAARVEPRSPQIQAGLAESAAALGRRDEAIAAWRRVLDLDPAQGGARVRLAELLLASGRPAEAVLPLQAALAAQPASPELRALLGRALLESGRPADAARELGDALRRRPELPGARGLLGVALLAAGRPAEALDPLRAGLREAPEAAGLWSSLGNALLALGRPAEAADALREALRRRSPWPEVQNNLAWILATAPPPVGDPAAAVAHAEAAVAASGRRDAQLLDTLAVAYAAAGRRGDAHDAARDGARVARARGELALASALEARAREYGADAAGATLTGRPQAGRRP